MGAMKVCHVITRLIVGGAQENTVATCIGLRKLGYDCELVTGPQTGPEGSLDAGMPVTIINELRREPNPVFDVLACRELYQLFRARRYDVVHTHSGKAGFVGRLAARLARVPVVVHTIHGPSFYRYQNPIGNWLFRWAEQLAGEWTTQFVSVADAMTEQYQAAGVAGKYVTIHSGMNLEPFLRVDSQPDFVVGKIARMFRLKGYEYLFEAAPQIVAAVPNVKFLLIGDGINRQRYERWAERLGMRDRFVFAGLVRPEEIPNYLAQMDVLVHLSLREGLPRTVTQALAAGKPVVAFDVDGAREVCRDGETGFLIRAEDAGGVAAAVIRLLQDKMLAARFGAQGREFVRSLFTEELMVRQIDELYRRLRR
jgi:glycosyltransferase involved in cell wall biosynthesis